jgi:hypothetical protein
MKAPNDPAHTHISMGTPKGVFAIGSKMKDFWEIYINALSQKKPMYLAENTGKESPILLDSEINVNKYR